MLAVLVKNVMKGMVENVIEAAIKFLLQCRKLEVFQQVKFIYRGFSPYANFITANFITVIFQKNP